MAPKWMPGLRLAQSGSHRLRLTQSGRQRLILAQNGSPSLRLFEVIDKEKINKNPAICKYEFYDCK